jgi:hypothetical protein
MDSINLSKIKQDVRIILDQNSKGEEELNVGEYTLDLDEIITKCIEPAVQWVHMNAPITKLKGENFNTHSVVDDNSLQLPDDFMRLVTVKVNNWRRALNTYLTEDDPMVSQILSGYPGLMPTYDKPAMVLRQEEDKQYLMLYPYDEDVEDDDVISAQYLPYPKLVMYDDSDSSSSAGDDDGYIEIEPAVYQAFLYYLAHLVKETYNEQNTFEQQAQALL